VNLSHSTIYEQLALAAGKAAGVIEPTLEAMAKDPAARQARDLAWIEFDGLLADKTQTLKKIGRWLFDRGVSVSDASVHRARTRVLDARRLDELKNQRTADVLKSLAGMDGREVLDAATKKAGQALLELFSKLQPEQLDDLTAPQWLRAFETAAVLQRSRAETGLIDQRVAALKAAFDRETKKRTEKGDGKLSAGDLEEIRKAVFGSAA
jgi:hypothetical protein